MENTNRTATRVLTATLTFVLHGDHPIAVHSIYATLRRVESEFPWRFETGNTGIYFPTVKPFGINRLIAGSWVIREGSFELAWAYGQGDAITRDQEDAFMAYLIKVGKRLEEEVGMTISRADVKMIMSITFN